MLILFPQYNPKDDDLSSDSEEVVPNSDSEREYPVILQFLKNPVLTPQESTSGKLPYINTDIFFNALRTHERLYIQLSIFFTSYSFENLDSSRGSLYNKQ